MNDLYCNWNEFSILYINICRPTASFGSMYCKPAKSFKVPRKYCRAKCRGLQPIPPPPPLNAEGMPLYMSFMSALFDDFQYNSTFRYRLVFLLKDFEIENKKLRETLNEYNTEFAEVKNQGIDRYCCIQIAIVLRKAHKHRVKCIILQIYSVCINISRGYNQSIERKSSRVWR